MSIFFKLLKNSRVTRPVLTFEDLPPESFSSKSQHLNGVGTRLLIAANVPWNCPLPPPPHLRHF